MHRGNIACYTASCCFFWTHKVSVNSIICFSFLVYVKGPPIQLFLVHWIMRLCFKNLLQLYYFLFQVFFFLLCYLYIKMPNIKFALRYYCLLHSRLLFLLDPQSEGSMKYPLFICPFVGISFWNFSFTHKIIKVLSNLKSDS